MWKIIGLLIALAISPAHAQSMAPIIGDSHHATGPAYTGPCDVTLTAGCAEAYSTARAMTSSYSGALFQVYNGTTTTDIGQVNHVADVAALLTACANTTTCVIGKVYGQINGNDLIPTIASGANYFGPATCNAGTYSCAPPVIIDPANGLPTVSTPYPTEMYNGGSITGITAGTGPLSAFAYLPTNAGMAECCGMFGVAHSIGAALTDGTDFLLGLTYGNGHIYSNCSSSTTICANIDIETFMNNGANYTPTALQSITYLSTTDGSASTNNINVYLNSATPIYTGTASATLNPGKLPRIGAGGDGSHTNTMFQEGLISNGRWTGTDYTNLSGNVSTFYGARSKDACSSTADMGYYWSSGHTSSADVSPLSTLLAYGVRRMRASYYGPIADLRDSLGTVNTYGPNASGCGIDSAAATFCAAHAPCTVAKLYNQGTWSSQNVGNVHDTDLDMAQAVTANQPTVNFTGLNSLPTMVFNGTTQYLCSATTGSNGTFFSLATVVTKRTGNTTNFNAALGVGGSNSSIGFSNSSGVIYSFIIANLISGGAYTESHFHSIAFELLNTGAGNTTLYGDNVSAGTANNSGFAGVGQGGGSPSTTPICLGTVLTTGTPGSFLTGEIAEATVMGVGDPSVSHPTTASSATFTAQEATWGTLPN